jgi:hypothetical protein
MRQNKTKQNKTKQNKTKQNKTKQNKTKQNKSDCLRQLFCCGKCGTKRNHDDDDERAGT